MKPVILYSTNCPRCKVLKTKLAQYGVEYTECSDEEKMLSLGIQQVPVLGIGNELLDFSQSINWLNNLEK